MRNDSRNETHTQECAAETADREQLLQELKYSDERYRLAAEISNEIILDYSLQDDSIYHVSNSVSGLYGIPQLLCHAPEQLISSGVVLPESAPAFLDLFHKIRTGSPQAACVVKCRTISGEIRWNQVMLTTLFDDDGHPYRAVGVLKDITSQRQAELRCESELQHRNAIKKDALLYYEADLTNRKMLFGLDGILRSQGLPHTDRYEEALELLAHAMVYIEDRALVVQTFAAENLLRQHAAGKDRVELEYRRMGERHEPFWVRATAYLADDQHTGAVLIYYYVNDINAEKIRQLQYEEQARKDLLTNVYNKGTAETLIREAVSAASEDQLSALLIVDLDDFKQVNDQLGHAYGDALLSETARKLTGLCAEEDIVGRIGGDEFAIYLRHLATEEDARRKAGQICHILHTEQTPQHACKESCTVGVALQPRHGTSFLELYQKADLALYEAKRRGKDTWCVYYDELALQHERPASVRAAIDCSDGKSFAENITDYVLRILYESRDLQRAIIGVIELVAKRFHFDRSYLFTLNDQGECVCAYEWCGAGIAPLPEELRLLHGSQLTAVRRRFHTGNIYFKASAQTPVESEASFPTLSHIKTRVQNSLNYYGRPQGFLGFDCYQNTAELTEEDLTALRGVTQMLDVFLSEHQASEKRRESSRLLQAVTDSFQTCTYVVDPETHRLRFVNRSTLQRIPRAVPGAICYETIRSHSAPCDDCPIAQMRKDGTRESHGSIFLEQHRLWAKYNASLIHLTNEKEYGLINSSDFTTEQQQLASSSLGISADSFTRDTTLYNALCQSTDDYLYMCDMTKDLFYFPKAMVEEFGLPSQVIEHAIPLWASYIHENERECFLQDIDNMVSGKTSVHNQDYRAKNKNGNWLWLRCRGYLDRDVDGNPTLFAGILTNLGKRTKIDPITGMPDKYDFESKARTILSTSPAEGMVLLLGLDNFKHINNLYGWEYGDSVLRESAQRLQAALPPRTQLYRLDGDNFGVFFPHSNRQLVEDFFRDASESFRHQHASGQYKYFCTVSGGYSVNPGTPISFDALFKQAEYALEYSKSSGKGRLNVYDNSSMHGRGRSLHLLELLQASVEQDFAGFQLHYQPQVEALSHTIVGAEALLRWECERYGSVSPNEFIPLLEQTGLIQKVGMWVIQQAAKTCRIWRQLRPDFTINVNVSAVQFQDKTFYQQLSQMVQSGELDPSAIHLELTESCISTSDSFLTSMFTALRTLGFRIEMDDFGTGYSSLAMLKNAPADVVKIDRAFVRNITHSDFDVTFIRFVVNLCHTAGIRVCLEGVETLEEYGIVSPMGLDLIQGFLFGRPENLADFESHFLQDSSQK